MKHLYIVVVSDGYIRDAQVFDPSRLPPSSRFDRTSENAEFDIQSHDECWVDAEGSFFVDVVLAASEEAAIAIAAKSSPYDKDILSAIRINDDHS